MPRSSLSGAAWLVQSRLGQFVPLPAILLLLACGALTAGWRLQRWLALEGEQARTARGAAEAANRAKSEFLAHMSHEIRTPLNAVLGMGQLLAETPLNAMQRRYVDVFATAGRHLQRLIEDLLDLSRVEAGRLELHTEPFSLREMVAELGGLFEARARARSLAFSLDCPADLPAFVRGDPQRLRQVLVNVLGNALKFTRSGSVSMQVRQPGGGDQIEFVVRDTGVGIPADRLDAVFEPFAQADSGISREFGGSGLGLAISRRLMLAMDGTVDLHSEPGRGTEVRLRLPLPPCEAPAPAAPAPHAPMPRWPGRRVLLVEDHPHNVMVVQGMLAATELTIDVAADGQRAVQMAREAHHDLILMDIQMPVLDGHAATRAIRQAERDAGRPATPILALSANAMPSDAQASLDAGCDGHLSKPLERSALLAAIAAHLGAGETDAATAAPVPDAGTATDEVLDPSAALKRLGDDRALYDRVCQSAAAQLAQWEARYAAAEPTEGRRLAHDLKSIAGVIGAVQLQREAARLEQQCVDAAPAQVDENLQHALEAVRQRLAAPAPG